MKVSSADVRAALGRHARPDKAEGMRRYLKSELPCLGVPVPVARRAAAELFLNQPAVAFPELERLVRPLWDDAMFREERFVALNILRLRPHRALIDAKSRQLLEHLIRTGAWWDLVDELASHVVRAGLENDPTAMGRVVRAWASSGELWLQRAALVSQVVRGVDTDVELLAFAIEHALDGKDFFLRKGIGWAMRSLARKRPAVVRDWLQRWTGRLSPLSVREAEKGLVRQSRGERLRRPGAQAPRSASGVRRGRTPAPR
ncbi:MAG: DNA alkylation repair protein [Myxococcaceae bacterium]|nr:DNA alkylation repair protein [Myxococcaceae bacterium]